MLRSEVWEVGVRLNYKSMLQVWVRVVRSFHRIFHRALSALRINYPPSMHSLAAMA